MLKNLILQIHIFVMLTEEFNFSDKITFVGKILTITVIVFSVLLHAALTEQFFS